MAIEAASSAPPAEKPAQSSARSDKSKSGASESQGAGGFLELMASIVDVAADAAVDPLESLEGKEALALTDDAQDATNLEAKFLLDPSGIRPSKDAEIATGEMPVPVVSLPEPQLQPQRPTVKVDAPGAQMSKDNKSPIDQPKAKGLAQDTLSPTSTSALQSLAAVAAGEQETKGQDGKFQAALEAVKNQAKDAGLQPAVGVNPAPAMVQEKIPERLHAAHDTVKNAPLDQPAPTAGLLAGGGPSLSTLASPQMSAPLEVAVAEKVAYWIGQDVQNAELQLDGLGKDAVQVSISMVGNEAQVTFRTDESVTRDALQAASGQLKDMLQREGVFLSGVSIGQSDAGGAKDGQRQPRQGHRQVGQVAASVAAAIAATRPAHGTTGRTVDLFV